MEGNARTIRYHALFDCDVLEAARWYDKRAQGLGASFVAVVEDRVDDICAHPFQFAKSSVGCRYSRVARFPYVVLYDLTESEVLFLGVLHTARSMEKWRERLDNP